MMNAVKVFTSVENENDFVADNAVMDMVYCNDKMKGFAMYCNSLKAMANKLTEEQVKEKLSTMATLKENGLANGNMYIALRNEIISNFAWFAVNISFRYKFCRDMIEDFAQNAVVALMDCIDKVDVEKLADCKFSTYAYTCIRRAIRRFGVNQYVANGLTETPNPCNHKHNQETNARRLSKGQSEIVLPTYVQTETQGEDGSTVSLFDLMDNGELSTLDKVSEGEREALLEKAMDACSEIERKAIKMRMEGKTLQNIMDALNLNSVVMAKKHCDRAEAKIRKTLED